MSLKAKEVEDKDANFSILFKVGVVQAADALERIARIRWFTKPRVVIPRTEIFSTIVPTMEFGSISDDYSEVSLYDVVAYPALAKSRGDLLLIIPHPLPPIDRVGADQNGIYENGTYQQIGNEAHENLGDYMQPPASGFSFQPRTRSVLTGPGQDTSTSDESDPNPSSTEIDWFGEVVDLGLDGTMTVRLGAADEVRDVELPFDRVVLVAHGDEVSDSDDEDSDDLWEDDLDLNDDMLLSWEAQYADGVRPEDASDDDVWSTEEDEDMPNLVDLSPPPEKKRQSSGSEDGISVLVEPSTSNRHERKDSSDQGLPELVDISAPLRNHEHLASSERTLDQGHDRADEVIVPADAQSIGQSRDRKSSTAAASTSSDSTDSSNDTVPPQVLILPDAPPTDHHFISKPPSLTTAKFRRIIKEHQIMRSSLPDGVFVRIWEDRLDILRVLIIGPRETPYELAPFVIDFYFSDAFPVKPPEAYFHSWTNGVGRVNPNLYEDGNICLSLLGTWPGDNGHDVWSAKGSTMLQVIVSILGLVLVREPYYSKSGFSLHLRSSIFLHSQK